MDEGRNMVLLFPTLVHFRGAEERGLFKPQYVPPVSPVYGKALPGDVLESSAPVVALIVYPARLVNTIRQVSHLLLPAGC